MNASSNQIAGAPSRATSLGPIVAAALLTALALVNVYRAWAQSNVCDEAYTYLAFLTGSLGGVFTDYTANNHVLFSVLAKLATGMFGYRN